MRALLYIIIVGLLLPVSPAFGGPNPDRRHWKDRDNDIRGYLMDRNSDGSFRYNSNPFVHAKPPTAEINCKYVERIDIHGERSFHFICP